MAILQPSRVPLTSAPDDEQLAAMGLSTVPPDTDSSGQPDYGDVKPIVPGNIQFYNRPKVRMPGPPGQHGTVYSSSREEDGKEVMFPTIYDSKPHSEDEAWQHYQQTGQHMGKFANPDDADKFGQKYHEDAAAGKYDTSSSPASSTFKFNSPIMPPALQSTPPALPSSVLGGKIGEGEQIPQQEMKQAGQAAYKSLMPKIAQITDDPASLHANTMSRIAQEEFKSAHPWGDPISAHPGTLGKIGHVLSRIGNIAGDVVAPGVIENIPGTDLNNSLQHAGLQQDLHKEALDAGDAATTAATQEATAEAPKKLQIEQDKESRLAKGDPEEQAFHDAESQISPVTGKKNSPLEAFRIAKQAAQKLPAQKSAHITYDQGIPVSVTDKDQNVYDVNDPKLPPDLKPLVDSATRAHAQRNSEEEQKEGRVAERGASAQARTFAQQEKMHDEKQDDLTAATKSMVEAAPGVLNLSKRVRSLIEQQKGSLGPAPGRWSEFMTGKVGAPNPDFARLRTDVGLLQTKLMRMHVGARGGEVMMQHFKDLIDTSKQSPENLEAALDEIDAYAKETGQQGKQKDGTPPVDEKDPLGIR